MREWRKDYYDYYSKPKTAWFTVKLTRLNGMSTIHRNYKVSSPEAAMAKAKEDLPGWEVEFVQWGILNENAEDD